MLVGLYIHGSVKLKKKKVSNINHYSAQLNYIATFMKTLLA